MTNKMNVNLILIVMFMSLTILKGDDDTMMDNSERPLQEGWKDMIIPSVELNSSINDGISLIDKIAKQAGAEKLGFKQIKIIQTPLVKNLERKIFEMKLENIPFSRLIDLVSDQLLGTWDSRDGVVTIYPYMAPNEFYFHIEENILKGLDLPLEKEIDKSDLVKSFNKFGVDVKNFNIEVDAITGDKVVSVSAPKNKIRFLKSIVVVLSKGLQITKEP